MTLEHSFCMIRLPGDLAKHYTSLRGGWSSRRCCSAVSRPCRRSRSVAETPEAKRRGQTPALLEEHLVEPRLPESQPRIVIGRPPSATRYGKHLLRSAAPPHVPPASRRMPGHLELLLSGSTSNSPPSWSNDATTQRSSYAPIGTDSNLIRVPHTARLQHLNSQMLCGSFYWP